ncbi:hypothetical protein ACO0R3_000446 [Hanseniaspora guilliermondii]
MIPNSNKSYQITPKNSFSNAMVINSTTLLTDDSSTTPIVQSNSIAIELQHMSKSLNVKFDEIKNILNLFNGSMECIESENKKREVAESKKIKTSPFNSTLQDNKADYSFYHCNNQQLFYEEYFRNSCSLPYDFKIINFLIQLLATDKESCSSIELLNFEDFKKCLLEERITFTKKFCMIYMIEKTLIKEQKNVLKHYLCLVDVEKLEIHVINPLNEYSINSDIINLKLLIDQSYKSTNTIIRLCHNPITTKSYNSGCHTFLNIYSLVSDLNQFLINVNNKANDQFSFFVPDNPHIRQQCYTVLMYLLESSSKKKGMEHYQYYKQHVKKLFK